MKKDEAMNKGSSEQIKKGAAGLILVLLLGTMCQVQYPITWSDFWGVTRPEPTVAQRIGISSQPTTAVDIVAQNPRLTLGTAATIASLIGYNAYAKYSALKERYKDLIGFVHRNRLILKNLTQNPDSTAYDALKKINLNQQLIEIINTLNDPVDGLVDSETFKADLEKDKKSLPYTFYLPELIANNIKKFTETLDIILDYLNKVNLREKEQEIKHFSQPQQPQHVHPGAFYGAAPHYPYPMPPYQQQYSHPHGFFQQPTMTHEQQFHHQLMERYRQQFFTWLQEQGYRQIPKDNQLYELFRRWISTTFSRQVAEKDATLLQDVFTNINKPAQQQIGYQAPQYLQYTPTQQQERLQLFASQPQERTLTLAEIEALGQEQRQPSAPIQLQQPTAITPSPAQPAASGVAASSTTSTQAGTISGARPEKGSSSTRPPEGESYYDQAKNWATRNILRLYSGY